MLFLHLTLGSASLLLALISWLRPSLSLFKLINFLVISSVTSGIIVALDLTSPWYTTCVKLGLYTLFLALSQLRHHSLLTSTLTA